MSAWPGRTGCRSGRSGGSARARHRGVRPRPRNRRAGSRPPHPECILGRSGYHEGGDMSRVVTALFLAVVLVPAAAGERARPVLTVAATSASGALPLTVRFTLDAPNATRWRLDFGDGRFEAANGQPPATVTHVYRTKGSFVAHLSTVYPSTTT